VKKLFNRHEDISQDLFHHYQIQPAELIKVDSYYLFWQRNRVYFLVPVSQYKEEELQEMKKLSDYMQSLGDLSVATFVQNTQGYFVSRIANSNHALFRCNRQYERNKSIGEELAIFHARGKKYAEEVLELNRIGQWKTLWEKRLEQLERFWQSKVNSHPENYFEQVFVESFPYYLGLTENAIQYVVDTELDTKPELVDAATICHQKLNIRHLKSIYHAKIPVEWTYDHFSRDLAEVIREHYFESGDESMEHILTFLHGYEKRSPLSPFSWRLLYARLIFPVHYYETVEGYYLTKTDDERKQREHELIYHLETAEKYEEFLGTFFEKIGLPVEKLGIRELSWLKK